MPARSVSVASRAASGFLRFSRDRVGVDHVHRVDVGQLALADGLRLRLHPVEVELRGLGVEVGSVVELHALAELEDQRLGIGLLPRLGQARLDAELDVERDQRLVDVVVDLPVDLAARQVRVHGGGLDVEADPERAALLRRGLRERHADAPQAGGRSDRRRSGGRAEEIATRHRRRAHARTPCCHPVSSEKRPRVMCRAILRRPPPCGQAAIAKVRAGRAPAWPAARGVPAPASRRRADAPAGGQRDDAAPPPAGAWPARSPGTRRRRPAPA